MDCFDSFSGFSSSLEDSGSFSISWRNLTWVDSCCEGCSGTSKGESVGFLGLRGFGKGLDDGASMGLDCGEGTEREWGLGLNGESRSVMGSLLSELGETVIAYPAMLALLFRRWKLEVESGEFGGP